MAGRRYDYIIIGAGSARGVLGNPPSGGPGARGRRHISKAAARSPVYSGFIAAGAEAGHRLTSDFTGFQQEGLGPSQLTSRDGKRGSAAVASGGPVRGGRPNRGAEIGARTSRI